MQLHKTSKAIARDNPQSLFDILNEAMRQADTVIRFDREHKSIMLKQVIHKRQDK